MSNTDTMKEVYLLAQEHCGLKVGDVVRVIDKIKDVDLSLNHRWCGNGFYRGEQGEIFAINHNGILVRFDGFCNVRAFFPYYALEKVERPEHKFKPYDPVLVRDEDDQRWCPDIFLYRPNICSELYACAKSDWKQCIPYKGNEHLSGTRREPEE